MQTYCLQKKENDLWKMVHYDSLDDKEKKIII